MIDGVLVSFGQVSSKHKPICEPVVLAFTTYSTADSSGREEVFKFLLCTFISSHPWQTPRHLHYNVYKSPHPRTTFLHKQVPPGAKVGSDKGSRHNAQYSKALPNFNNIFLLFY